mmetsp:Transcript_52395/g.113537  ORF Transcript_52395/g.113537 Transcript_52395/m.113537 type:complete len:239 (+) Transcript_52395:45-761(+)
MAPSECTKQGKVEISSLSVCCSGRLHSLQNVGGEYGSSGLAMTWDTERLRLVGGFSMMASVEWAQIDAIWISIQSTGAKGLVLELTVQAARAHYVDFFHLTTAVTSASSELLQFLHAELEPLVQPGQPPAWLTSRWAVKLLGFGVSLQSQRRSAFILAMLIEALLIAALLAQFQRLLGMESRQLVILPGGLGWQCTALLEWALLILLLCRCSWAAWGFTSALISASGAAGKTLLHWGL